jgi:GntP family gluconate:H+ symporter
VGRGGTLFPMNSAGGLLLLTLVAVVGLVALIARFKLNAFVALILASLFVGGGAGLPLTEVADVFLEGVGAVLGSIALVIALGTIIGKLLAESGGAQVVAAALVRALGRRRLHWAMLVLAFGVGFPVWFTVGLVLLAPIGFALLQETKLPVLFLGLPLLAGLSVAHGLVPPHPGPLAAVELLGADLGKTILWSIGIGLPTAAIAGPLIARRVAAWAPVELGRLAEQLTGQPTAANPPGLGVTVLAILLPIGLILAATVAKVALPASSGLRTAASILGHPMLAMLSGMLLCVWVLGTARGFGAAQVLRFSEECLGPVGMVLLVVGCGGGFSKVLTTAGVGRAISTYAEGLDLSPMVLGWLLAALIRVATGSATVSVTTAAGLVADYAARAPGANLELVVIATGAGSLILSHVNDGGFWFVKEYFNLSVTQTLKSWTVVETVISITALGLCLAAERLASSAF